MAVADVFPALFDNYFIKVIFLLHATLMSIANIANNSNTDKIAYMSYNSLFLLCVLLAILVDKNTDVILVAVAFDVLCIPLDVILLISAFKMGTVAILLIVTNLLLRPISSILMLKNYSARAGVEDPTSGLLEVNVQSTTVPRARSAYQNIDEPNQTLP